MLIFNYLVIMNQFSNVVSYFLACQTQIENQLATATDGGQPNSTTEVVANVLEHNRKNNQFLQNVGLQAKRRPRVSGRDAAAQQEAEQMANADLRPIISNQSKQLQKLEQTRVRGKEEMTKQYADLEAKLKLLLDIN